MDIQTSINCSTDNIWEESPSAYDTQHNFDTFEKIINSLEKEISNARKYKSMKEGLQIRKNKLGSGDQRNEK